MVAAAVVAAVIFFNVGVVGSLLRVVKVPLAVPASWFLLLESAIKKGMVSSDELTQFGHITLYCVAYLQSG